MFAFHPYIFTYFIAARQSAPTSPHLKRNYPASFHNCSMNFYLLNSKSSFYITNLRFVFGNVSENLDGAKIAGTILTNKYFLGFFSENGFRNKRLLALINKE